MNTTDTPTQPVATCTHVRKHWHGTRGAYNAKCCACEECLEANARYTNAWYDSKGRHRRKKPRRTYIPIAGEPQGIGEPITTCTHKHQHWHGTSQGYGTCACRCEHCASAASKARHDARARCPARTDRTGKKTPLKGLELPEGETQGSWLSTRPDVSRDIARACAKTVTRHALNDADARDIINTLGIMELAK